MRRVNLRKELVSMVAITFSILPYLIGAHKEAPPTFPKLEVSKSADPLTEEPLEPMDQCGQLNQVQSVVIQILSAHYEYGKGIHRLHEVVDNLQKDIIVLKSTLDELDKRQSALENRNVDNATLLSYPDPFGAHKFLTSLLEGNDTSKHRHYLKSGIYAIQRSMGNLTSTVQLHGDELALLNKRFRRLRRTIKQVTASKPPESRHAARKTSTVSVKTEQEENMLAHFMAKQKDINVNLIKRMMFLEEKWKRMSVHQRDPPQHPRSYNGCPSGFVRHYSSCYKFENITMSWVDGEKHCQGLNPDSHLVGIETREEGEYVVKYRAHNNVKWSSNYMWTGGNDMMEEGKWTWVGTGRSLLYTYWRAGEPDNHNDEQHCIYMRADGADQRWDDWNCHAAKLNIVCEINLEP